MRETEERKGEKKRHKIRDKIRRYELLLSGEVQTRGNGSMNTPKLRMIEAFGGCRHRESKENQREIA